MSKFNTKKLITLSVLVAMDVVLTRFLSINAWNTRIGFGFVPMVIAAMMYGPLSAGIVAALADFIGAILFPTGPYFPGFTFSVFLMGIVFGLFLYKDRSFWRVVVSVLITQFVISLFLDSKDRIWLTTQGGGCCRYVPETDSFVSYSTDDGLPDDILYQIVEDKSEKLWMTTSKGLVRLSRAMARKRPPREGWPMSRS